MKTGAETGEVMRSPDRSSRSSPRRSGPAQGYTTNETGEGGGG
jgi:hypothetical protein